MMRPFGWTALRWLFGLFFLISGAVMALTLFGPDSPASSGLTDRILAVSFIVGGGALLFRRTAPLGIVVLAPAVLVMLFLQFLMKGQVLWGTFAFAAFAALAWRYRSAFTGKRSRSDER